MDSIESRHHNLIKAFRQIKAEQKTVQLSITYNNSTVILYFADGCPIFAHPAYQKDKLGETLIKNGIVTKDQVNKALIKQRELTEANRKIMIGTILVDMGFISKKQLQNCMKARIVGTFMDIFDADNISVAFLPKTDTLEYDITAADDIEHLITVAKFARRKKPSRMNEISPGDVFTVSAELSQQQGLSNDDWKIIVLLDSERTIYDISCISSLSSLQVYPIIESLLERKIIKRIETEPVSKSKKLYVKMRKPVTSVLNRVIGRLRRA